MMKPVSLTWCIQIDITQYCVNKCSNCTHLIPHYHNPKHMTFIKFKEAVDGLDGYKGLIGIIGGEPTLNPDWQTMLMYLSAKVGKNRTGFWTCTDKHLDFIRERAGYVNFNPHTEDVEHSPVLVASKDVIADKDERMVTIHNCWLADKWSPSVTEKGLYRCEVMGSMDRMFNWNLGKDIKDWNKDITEYADQIEMFCNLCGVCLNLKGRKDKDNIDDMSPSNISKFGDKGSVRVKQGKVNVVYPNNMPEKESQPWRYITRMK